MVDCDQSSSDSAAPESASSPTPKRSTSPSEIGSVTIAPEDLDPVTEGEVLDDDRSAVECTDRIGHSREPP